MPMSLFLKAKDCHRPTTLAVAQPRFFKQFQWTRPVRAVKKHQSCTPSEWRRTWMRILWCWSRRLGRCLAIRPTMPRPSCPGGGVWGSTPGSWMWHGSNWRPGMGYSPLRQKSCRSRLQKSAGNWERLSGCGPMKRRERWQGCWLGCRLRMAVSRVVEARLT